MSRKFYLTRITIEVLSEEPIDDLDMEQISYEVDEGSCVGSGLKFDTTEINEQQVRDRLADFGSDPAFFDLDEEEVE